MSEWQPISTAPKDADALLLSDGVTVDVGGWISAADQGAEPEEELRISAGWWLLFTSITPTHWMPLPHPPSVNAGATPVEKGAPESAPNRSE